MTLPFPAAETFISLTQWTDGQALGLISMMQLSLQPLSPQAIPGWDDICACALIHIVTRQVCLRSFMRWGSAECTKQD